MGAHGALFLLCFPAIAFCQLNEPPPILSGYVTRAASGSDFDVNGIRILCGQETAVEAASGNSYYAGCFGTPPVIGQAVDVYGHKKKKLHAVAAERIDIKRIHHDEISGYAVIDAVAGSAHQVPGLEIRADGYRMLLTGQTRVAFEAPLTGVQDVMANVWAEYEANAGPGGVFVLKGAKFSQNIISEREDGMRTKTEYDPSGSSRLKAEPRSNRSGAGCRPKTHPAVAEPGRAGPH